MVVANSIPTNEFVGYSHTVPIGTNSNTGRYKTLATLAMAVSNSLRRIQILVVSKPIAERWDANSSYFQIWVNGIPRYKIGVPKGQLKKGI